MGKTCPNPACGTFIAEEEARFCSRCATPLSYAMAPTQVNPSLASSWAPPPLPAAPPPSSRGRSVGIALAAMLVTLGVGGGALVFLSRGPAPARSTAIAAANQPEQRAPSAPSPAALSPSAPSAPSAPSPSAPSPSAPTPSAPTPAWLSLVHYHSPVGVDLHPGDLDAADGRCARLTGAMITIEAPGGDQFVSDGDPQRADLELRLGAPAGGAYDVEMGVGHNRFVAVGSGLVGDQAIDLDRLGERVGRFVRISTRRTGGTICLDGVRVERRVPHA